MLQRLADRLIPVLALLLTWEFAAHWAASRLFPPFTAVLAALGSGIASGQLPYNLAITLFRVACAFSISMLAGAALGIAMGRWRRLDRTLDSLLTGLLNLPALVTIVLLYVWFGLNETTAILSVALNKFPSTAITLREGAKALDSSLSEMARSVGLAPLATWRRVLLPQLYPYLFVAARSGLALIWKIVLVAELLGRNDGVGFQIQVYFQLFDVTAILAYTIAFIVVVQLIEWGILQPLERRANRWRASPES